MRALLIKIKCVSRYSSIPANPVYLIFITNSADVGSARVLILCVVQSNILPLPAELTLLLIII